MASLPLGFRLKHAWDVFRSVDPDAMVRSESVGYSSRPDRARLLRGNERSITSSIYNRIALDVSQIDIHHVRLDDDDRFTETIKSNLEQCLTVEANLDQTPRHFIQDVVLTMFSNGVAAIVPVVTDVSPFDSSGFDVMSLRVGQITEWKPFHVKVRLYDERDGQFHEIWLRKSFVAIVENPLYSVINEPNSTMQRLIRKLNLLDVIDEQSGSGKLDLIIQLPYAVKTDLMKARAEERRKSMEEQLANSKYGIAYADSTEKITQLNRSVENNLLRQIEYLTSMLYGQLGITQGVMDGSADEKTMLNYYNRTIEPIIAAIVDNMKRKFLTKTARTQKQSIAYYRDPFRLVPVSELAEISDKMTRNEIMTSNEVRQAIGMRPSKDPEADELRNKNLSRPKEDSPVVPEQLKEGENQNE